MKNQIKSFTKKTARVKSSELSRSKLTKIADILVNIADQLDTEDPTLAAEADSLLQETLKQAAMGCSDKCSGNYHAHDQDAFSIPSPSFSPKEELHIEEIEEPTPEYDEVGLDDIKS
jgi:D-arabinose 5-phosphate isomerase GutQ